MPRKRDDVGRGALAGALARVGDRWILSVVAALLSGPRRYSDLFEELPGIAPNVLAARLRSLEEQSLVVARPYSTRPPRYVYELTSAGADLAGALRMLAEWGARLAGDEESHRHLDCGSRLEWRLFCPTCGHIVDDDESSEGVVV